MREEEMICDRVSPGELLLFAAGEKDDPALAEHVAHCLACRAYLAELEKLRVLLAIDEEEPVSSEIIARLKAEARGQRSVRPVAGRKTHPLSSDRRPAGWEARVFLMAAGLILFLAGVGVWRWYEGRNRGPASRDIPEYLAGASAQLLAYQAALAGENEEGEMVKFHALLEAEGLPAEEGLSFDPGLWEVVITEPEGLGDLEFDLSELESSLTFLKAETMEWLLAPTGD